VSAKNRLIKDIQMGNRELMRTNHSRDVKSDFHDDARTWLKNTQDELVAAQGYIHHLKTELHERDEQLEVSQAQATELQDTVEHL
jgi:hypothetical protein